MSFEDNIVRNPTLIRLNVRIGLSLAGASSWSAPRLLTRLQQLLVRLAQDGETVGEVQNTETQGVRQDSEKKLEGNGVGRALVPPKDELPWEKEFVAQWPLANGISLPFMIVWVIGKKLDDARRGAAIAALNERGKKGRLRKEKKKEERAKKRPSYAGHSDTALEE